MSGRPFPGRFRGPLCAPEQVRFGPWGNMGRGWLFRPAPWGIVGVGRTGPTSATAGKDRVLDGAWSVTQPPLQGSAVTTKSFATSGMPDSPLWVTETMSLRNSSGKGFHMSGIPAPASHKIAGHPRGAPTLLNKPSQNSSVAIVWASHFPPEIGPCRIGSPPASISPRRG